MSKVNADTVSKLVQDVTDMVESHNLELAGSNKLVEHAIQSGVVT